MNRSAKELEHNRCNGKNWEVIKERFNATQLGLLTSFVHPTGDR